MYKRFFLKCFFCIALPVVLILFFPACADNEPEIITADVVIIFDFQDKNSPPLSRLSVFVQPGTELQRMKQLEISAPSGYEWMVDEPVQFTVGAKQWAGYENLVPPYGENIQPGQYTVTYIDRREHKTSDFITIAYPEKLLSATADKISEIMGTKGSENIALYADSGEMVYYGERKKKWTADQNIWDEYSNAVIMRICWSFNNVECLMPPIYRSGFVPSQTQK